MPELVYAFFASGYTMDIASEWRLLKKVNRVKIQSGDTE